VFNKKRKMTELVLWNELFKRTD